MSEADTGFVPMSAGGRRHLPIQGPASATALQWEDNPPQPVLSVWRSRSLPFSVDYMRNQCGSLG